MVFVVLFLDVAVSVPLNKVHGSVTCVLSNWTVTLHDFAGPRLFPVHVSAKIVNCGSMRGVTVSTDVAEPPEFVSVNVAAGVAPGSGNPKSKKAVFQAS
jgi:hypothetical protein